MTTSLRQTYERARALEPEKQLLDCIDQIENVEIMVGELLDAYEKAGEIQISKSVAASEGFEDDAVDLEELSTEYFYESRDIMVHGGPGAFTCLASDVDPLPDRVTKSARNGLDFVGITCDDQSHPVLGVVQSPRDTTPYALLLRSLACLAEMVAPSPLAHADRLYFKGLLGAVPSFDVDLVIFAAQEEAITPLAELTRDLAESVRASLSGRPDFPPVLRQIACLRMNPNRFDGRLRLDWRI